MISMAMIPARPRRSVLAFALASAAVLSLPAGSLAFAQTAPPAPSSAAQAPAAAQPEPNTEEDLRRQLVGKTFYLRGGYLDSSLGFNEHGGLIGHSPQGSYTLNLIEVDKVRLGKHKVELYGVRYGLHFLGALPYQDPASAVDKVCITPKKKIVRITIDRELVIKPKKQKAVKPRKGMTPAAAASSAQPPSTALLAPAETSQTDELTAEVAAAPEAERPADLKSVTTTTSPAHAAHVLEQALDNIFASGLDARMMAAMPDFWKLYYQDAAAKTDFHPSDPSVLRQDTVDQKARLLTSFEPPSNEYAQANGVAGMALYHAVIGPDGKPGEIAVGRPIGFGLDENAVEAIRKVSFEPATKDGKAVPVLLDLVVEFHIYSRRTAAVSAAPTSDGPGDPPQPKLPGPYSVQHPQ